MADPMQDLASAFYAREHLGFRKPLWKSNPDEAAEMVAALVGAAAGDGDLAPAEREWIAGYFAAQGYSADLVESVRTATPLSMDEVVDLTMQGSLMFAGPTLIYDAIRACAADGEYHADERAAIAALADALDLTQDELAQIEALVEEEEALKAKRIALLLPDGHPNLLERYQP